MRQEVANFVVKMLVHYTGMALKDTSCMRGSRNFFQGGGGPAPTSRQRFFCLFLFVLVLNLFYSLQRASNGFITEKTILSKDPEGVYHFPGGANFFHGGGGGPNANFYRNPHKL